MEGEGGENEVVPGRKREPYFPNSKSERVKVMCLFKGPWIDQHGIIQDGPKAMDEDEVVNSHRTPDGRLFYWFDRFDHTYDARYFATLPDATADEMQEEEREAIIM